MKLWQPLTMCLSKGQKAVLVLIKHARGSVPRSAGAGLVVLPSGSFHGTIGGGALEWQALQHAATFFDGDSNFEEVSMPLGPNLGQCCGGHVSLSYELWTPSRVAEAQELASQEAAERFETICTQDADGLVHRQIAQDDGTEVFGAKLIPVAIFGAGHVGKALMKALSLLPMRVVWVDSRADIFPKLVPDNVDMYTLTDPRNILPDLARETAIIILTHSHAQDLSILEAALKAEFSLIGVIGSASKRARFESLLLKSGMEDELAKSFLCPIGMEDISGKEPSVIAASVAAQILMEKGAILEN